MASSRIFEGILMAKKKKKKLTKAGKIVFGTLIALGVVIIALVVINVMPASKNNDSVVTSLGTSVESAETEISLSEKYDALYEEYYAMNSDYVGILEWKNNLLYNYDSNSEDQYPGLIVKSHIIEDGEGDINAANAEYLRMDITRTSVSYGQEFMDGSNVVDDNNVPTDQNIIIYGHFVYADHNLKFGPLHTFEDASTYDTYDTFTLTFNHEQRTYQVTDAFFYDKDSFNGTREESPFAPNYSDEELAVYMNDVKNTYENCLDTGITIESGDNFVTLQTCVENDDNRLFIVLGKEISRESFE